MTIYLSYFCALLLQEASWKKSLFPTFLIIFHPPKVVLFKFCSSYYKTFDQIDDTFDFEKTGRRFIVSSFLLEFKYYIDL